jgi:hypothetical protein
MPSREEIAIDDETRAGVSREDDDLSCRLAVLGVTSQHQLGREFAGVGGAGVGGRGGGLAHRAGVWGGGSVRYYDRGGFGEKTARRSRPGLVRERPERRGVRGCRRPGRLRPASPVALGEWRPGRGRLRAGAGRLHGFSGASPRVAIQLRMCIQAVGWVWG